MVVPDPGHSFRFTFKNSYANTSEQPHTGKTASIASVVDECGFKTFKYSQYKKKRKLFNDIFFRVKIIDFKNDSISVALPFNKKLCSKVLT